jgi:hypothetical protein
MSADASLPAAAGAAGAASMHVLEKLWAVGRILTFTCRTPLHVFILALINRAFRECMLEYNVGASILDRIFDARNEWQSEDDVKQVWSQAGRIIMKQEETAPQEQQPPFGPELFAEMVAAMKHENARAAIEYARIPHEEREAAWKASPHFAFAPEARYAENYARFAAENPMPTTIFAPARHRLTQSRGTLAVAFRGCRPSIDWSPHVASAELIVIHLFNRNLSGTVDFSLLPAALNTLWLSDNQLSGNADLTGLPAALQNLLLENNLFSGSVDLTQLPQSLETLALDNNKLSGSVDLTKLPESFQWCYMHNNLLSGRIDLTKLPPKLEWLGLQNNQFDTSVDLTQLPASLLRLLLENNKLSGSVDLTKLPSSLEELRLYDNHLSGPVDLTRLPAAMLRLHLANNNFSDTVDLTQLPASLQNLLLCQNNFSGSVDLTHLPASLQEVDLENNSFSGVVDTSQLRKTLHVGLKNSGLEILGK